MWILEQRIRRLLLLSNQWIDCFPPQIYRQSSILQVSSVLTLICKVELNLVLTVLKMLIKVQRVGLWGTDFLFPLLRLAYFTICRTSQNKHHWVKLGVISTKCWSRQYGFNLVWTDALAGIRTPPNSFRANALDQALGCDDRIFLPQTFDIKLPECFWRVG